MSRPPTPAPDTTSAPSPGRDDPSAYEIRDLRSRDEMEACVELQREVWGEDFDEVVPPSLLQVEQKLGGVVAAAFGPRGRPAGFVFGMTGLRDGRPSHWSHMLGVRPSLRGMGLGRRLKAYQRRRLLERGIREAFWTFDPLEARNAHLNLNRLGARPVEYRVDMYGTDTGSDLHSGLGTDRFVVRWSLEAPRVVRALAGERLEEDLPAAAVEAPVVNAREEDGAFHALPEPDAVPEDPYLRIALPLRIQEVKSRDAEEAWRWRRSTRRAFGRVLSGGYRVAGFRRDPGSDRCAYVLAAEDAPGAGEAPAGGGARWTGGP